jgi:phosphatidylinositol glycan class K
LGVHPQAQHIAEEVRSVQGLKREGAAMVQEEQSWSKQIVGAAALAGCAMAWAAGSWLES